ncbi:histidine phosphatase family protein [Paenibacillus sp. XY044]|uniref:histidine phosphatase family protein n=1 Tax=Paenibacillus sp. XY044 TaxID=2026089 RepID=UPI000B992CCE|nr:histidine phosphatase family protein [Paenibacillus sp. XY044]OZB96161.1 histidine phosphatase family protein [Paenibacillus sp. XY044]
MKTYIYMVRHGESPKLEGNERTRGLTDKGKSDTIRITEVLMNEGIDTFVSSPYSRAILTIEDLARAQGKEIIVYEDLKELVFLDEGQIVPDQELMPTVRRMFSNPGFSLPGGESLENCQRRVFATFKDILNRYKGHKVVIGTHGLVMTLMMGYFDQQYNLEFLLGTSKPDIYKMEFDEGVFKGSKRLWIEPF